MPPDIGSYSADALTHIIDVHWEDASPEGFLIGGRWYGGDPPNIATGDEAPPGSIPAPHVPGKVGKRYDVDGNLLAEMTSAGGGRTVGVTLGLDGEGNGIGGSLFYQTSARVGVIDNKGNSIIGCWDDIAQDTIDFEAGPLFSKCGPSGSLLWTYLTVSHSPKRNAATGLDCDSQGNIFFGWSDADSLEFEPQVTGHIGKLSPEGSLIWQKTIGPQHNMAAGVVASKDGHSFWSVGGGEPGATDYRVEAYDPDGVGPLWTLNGYFSVGCLGNNIVAVVGADGSLSETVGKVNAETGEFIWSKSLAGLQGMDIAETGDIFYYTGDAAGAYSVGCLASSDGAKNYETEIPTLTGELLTSYYDGIICSGKNFALVYVVREFVDDFADRDHQRHDEYSVKIYSQESGSLLRTIPWGRYELYGGSAKPLYPIDYRLDSDEVNVLSRASPL